MKSIKKIIQYSLLGFVIFIILAIIIGNIFSHIFGLQKVEFRNEHYPISYFRKSALQEITMEVVYKNRFNDSVYIFKYADSFKIALWAINQNSLVNFTTNIDTNQKRIIPKGWAAYESLSLYLLNINRKTFNHNLRNVSICFNKCSDIQNIINTKNCQYYYLKAWEIYLISNTNSYYDICLGLNNSTHSDFMAYSKNNKLYILLLYAPTKGDNITPDAIQKIINLPLE